MQSLAKKLVSWYRQNRILYPWRRTTDPYRVWLSEILLQQTRIPVVEKYYEQILRKYPTFFDLVQARESEFLAIWSGIGYYRRAHHMLQCAKMIQEKHGGSFPSDIHELLALPGIGNYTAGAIRNICFDLLTPAVDGNIRRVLSRLTLTTTNLEEVFLKLAENAPSSDYFQSLMELGEQICLPEPRCKICPVSKFCEAYGRGKQSSYPPKMVKKRPERFHWYFLMLSRKHLYYYIQNANREFLKTSWMFPDLLSRKVLTLRDVQRSFRKQLGLTLTGLSEVASLFHAVTFRKISVHVMKATSFDLNGSTGKWLSSSELEQYHTSSVIRKILQKLNRQGARLSHLIQNGKLVADQ